MNLFRSEEHVRNWSQFDPASADGIMPLRDWVEVFSAEGRKHLLDGEYLSRWLPLRYSEREDILRRLGRSGPFWTQYMGGH